MILFNTFLQSAKCVFENNYYLLDESISYIKFEIWMLTGRASHHNSCTTHTTFFRFTVFHYCQHVQENGKNVMRTYNIITDKLSCSFILGKDLHLIVCNYRLTGFTDQQCVIYYTISTSRLLINKFKNIVVHYYSLPGDGLCS